MRELFDTVQTYKVRLIDISIKIGGALFVCSLLYINYSLNKNPGKFQDKSRLVSQIEMADEKLELKVLSFLKEFKGENDR